MAATTHGRHNESPENECWSKIDFVVDRSPWLLFSGGWLFFPEDGDGEWPRLLRWDREAVAIANGLDKTVSLGYLRIGPGRRRSPSACSEMLAKTDHGRGDASPEMRVHEDRLRHRRSAGAAQWACHRLGYGTAQGECRSSHARVPRSCRARRRS